MHPPPAVEHAALRAPIEPGNPATERSRSTSDANQSQMSLPVQKWSLDGHLRPSLFPMLHQPPTSHSGKPVRDRPPPPSEISPKWSLEWHPIHSHQTLAPHPLCTRVLRSVPTFWPMIPSLPADPRHCPALHSHPQNHNPGLQKPTHWPELTARVACDTAGQSQPCSNHQDGSLHDAHAHTHAHALAHA